MEAWQIGSNRNDIFHSSHPAHYISQSWKEFSLQSLARGAMLALVLWSQGTRSQDWNVRKWIRYIRVGWWNLTYKEIFTWEFSIHFISSQMVPDACVFRLLSWDWLWVGQQMALPFGVSFDIFSKFLFIFKRKRMCTTDLQNRTFISGD